LFLINFPPETAERLDIIDAIIFVVIEKTVKIVNPERPFFASLIYIIIIVIFRTAGTAGYVD